MRTHPRRTRIPLALALLAAMLVAAPQPAAAASLTVTKTADTADGECSASDCSLREAISAANASPGADTITVPAGLFRLARAVAAGSSPEDANDSGDLDVTGPVTLIGAGAALTVISAAGSNDRALHIISGSSAISGVTITDGSGTDQFGAFSGGGVQLEQGAALTLSDSVVTDNRARFGAGIAAYGALTLRGVTISENAGNTSAGIDMARDNPSLPAPSLTAINTTISGNSATFSGGGIGVFAGAATLTSVTITANTADSNGDGGGNGGGIVVDDGQGASVTLTGTILAGNADASASDKSPDCSGTLLSQGYNLIQSEAGCSVVGVRIGDVSGAALLGPLTNNGGPTPTHAPQSGSPAIDGGDPTSPGGSCPAADQRGTARPIDANGDALARCDIGAVEVIPGDLALSGSVDPGFAALGLTMRYSASVLNRGAQAVPSAVIATTLPASLRLQTASGSGWSCATSGQSVTCTSGSIAAGTSAGPLVISARVLDTAGSVTVALQLSSTTQDISGGDNSVTLTTPRGSSVYAPWVAR